MPEGVRGRSLRRRFWLIGAAIALAVVIYALAVYRARPADIIFYGNVDIREVNLGFRVSGRVAELTVDEGDAVRAEQVLGRLDSDPYERELREARAQASSLGRRWALLRSGYRVEDVAQARAALAERRATLADAERIYERESKLKDTGAIAERAYDDALAARDEARARFQAAEQNLAELERGYRHEEVAEAQANHERAQAAVAEAELRLDDTTLRAPADGVILTRATEPGAILAAGTTVFTLSLSRPVWVRVFVNERDLGRVTPGRTVLIYTDTRPRQPYHGQVGYVSPNAEFTPKNVETPDLRTALVYRARLIVQDPDGGLLQGMPVTARLPANAAQPAH